MGLRTAPFCDFLIDFLIDFLSAIAPRNSGVVSAIAHPRRFANASGRKILPRLITWADFGWCKHPRQKPERGYCSQFRYQSPI